MEALDDDFDEEIPTTVRGGAAYKRIVRSERKTVPPPNHSEVRAIIDGADDTGQLPAIPRPAKLPA